MTYFCADDYGLGCSTSAHIQQCTKKGVLGQISVFPNFGEADLHELPQNIRLSLHLNLVEGKCMADAAELELLADKSGNFRHTFGGLLLMSLLHKKDFQAQVAKEIRAQVLFWSRLLPDGADFCVDSHQHTHMIPAIFRTLNKVLRDENIPLTHMRIPAEPLLPYLLTPSLYWTYRPINILKQWLLKLLWLQNKRTASKYQIPSSLFFGILFSGKMDEKRVRKILPKYEKLAQKSGKDVEVLFHPGFVDRGQAEFAGKHVVFEEFYLSENRKTEFDSVIKLSERSVQE